MKEFVYQIEYEEGSLLDQEFKRGLKQGIEQGIERDIKKMLEKGFSVEDIADILEVSIEKVQAVKEKYKL